MDNTILKHAWQHFLINFCFQETQAQGVFLRKDTEAWPRLPLTEKPISVDFYCRI